jgi:hypothetical protein
MACIEPDWTIEDNLQKPNTNSGDPGEKVLFTEQKLVQEETENSHETMCLQIQFLKRA